MPRLPNWSRILCRWLPVGASVLLVVPCAAAESQGPDPAKAEANVAAGPAVPRSDGAEQPTTTEPESSDPDATGVPEDRERVSLTTSLITPIFGAYYLEANVRLADEWALLVNASSLVLDNADWTTTTGTVGAGVSYNWSGTALRGWYTVAVGEILFSSWEHEPSEQTASIVLGYSAIALMGYRFIWDAGPVVDVGAGFVGLHFPSAKVEVDGETIRSRPMTKYYPAVKAAVGWAF